MYARKKLLLVVALAAGAFSTASDAREDSAPRGGDRPGDHRQARTSDDARSTATTTRANDNVAGDRRGNKDVPDDNNRNRGGGKDDGPGHR